MRALITGATGGLGEALVRLLIREGYSLIVTGRNLEKLKKLAAAYPVEYFVCDLAQDRKPLLDILQKEKIDLVINNAGFGLYGEADLASYQALFEVNAGAVAEITLAALERWKARGEAGIVLNVSSVAGEVIAPQMALYAAAKAFVTHLSQSLDYEYAPYGIRVLVHLPGQIATEFASRAAKTKVARTPWMVDPDKVARAIYRQIHKRQRVQIYNFFYRLLLFLTHFLPQKVVAKSIENTLRKRRSS